MGEDKKYDHSNEYLKTFQKYENFNNVNYVDGFHTNDIAHLSKLKNDLSALADQIESYLTNKDLNEQEWQKVIALRNSAKVKLDSGNNKITEILKHDANTTDKVKYLQIQRFRRIFDQLTSEHNIRSKKIDTRYQTFILFDTNKNSGGVSGNKTRLIESGKAIIEAIVDVESLTEQAHLNLDILRKGNRRMNKVYSRLNNMVDKHLFDVRRLQKNINYVLNRNKNVVSIVGGIFVFIILYKFYSKLFR